MVIESKSLIISTFHYSSFIEAPYLDDPFKSILAKTCSKDLWILGYYFHTIRIIFIPEKIHYSKILSVINA